MTPAIDLLKKAKAEHRVHSYQHDPKAPSYGLEAAEKLGLAPECVFKTLLAATEKGELLVAVVPVVGSLDLKALAAAAGAKKADMADPTAPRSAPLVIWSAASARWGRRNACAPLSTRPHASIPPFTSVAAGAGWNWNSRPRPWRNIPRGSSPLSAKPEPSSMLPAK